MKISSMRLELEQYFCIAVGSSTEKETVANSQSKDIGVVGFHCTNQLSSVQVPDIDVSF